MTALSLLFMSIALITAESSVYFREQFEDGGKFKIICVLCFLNTIYAFFGVRACDGVTIDLIFYVMESPICHFNGLATMVCCIHLLIIIIILNLSLGLDSGYLITNSQGIMDE